MRLSTLIIFCAVSVVAGCGTKPTAAPVPAPPVIVKTAPPPTVVDPPPEPMPEEVAVAPVPEPMPPAEERVEPTTEQPPPAPLDRFILFTPSGPLVIEVEVLLGKRHLVDAFGNIVEQALTAADADGDGRPMWSEVLASSRFKAGEFGNLPFNSANEEKQITDKYDSDKDGVVDKDEVPRFLTRNAGGSRPFSFRGTTEWRYKNSRNSPLWQVLDRNGDGLLSAEEIAAAGTSLRLRDDNEDEMLTAAELQTAPTDGMNNMSMPRRLKGISAGAVLGPFTDWTAVRLALEQHYALGRNLVKANISPASVFEHLDENNNGRMDRGEVPRLANCPAALRLQLQLEDRVPGESAWSVLYQAEEFAALGKVHPTPGGLMIEFAGSKVKLALNDTVGQSNYEQQAAQLVMQYDANADGYLEKDEIPEAAAMMLSFVAVDANQDGKVYPEEVAALLERQQGALRCQVHVKGADRDDAFFAWLDENSNERLEPRELDAAAERLAKLSADGSEVHADQIPGSMLLVFARGNLETADALFVAPPVFETASSDQPAWFRGMDTNADGALSRREFVGEAAQFDEWDVNHDHYLTLDEFPAEAQSQPMPLPSPEPTP